MGFQAILNNKVPANWEKKGYPSLKPLGSWYSDMIQRVEFFADWVTNGKPFAYWISSLFFPQGFLTSVLQAFARANLVPVDILSHQIIVEDFYDTSVLDKPEEEGILAYGAFMTASRGITKIWCWTTRSPASCMCRVLSCI